MKVRIGISLGPAAVPAGFGDAVDRAEQLGIDSLWLSEMVFGSLVEPFAGVAYALSRTSRLKVGTGVAVLPGRHPVLVAKQLSSLASLAPKRVLPVFGLRSAIPAERELFVVPDGQRAAVFDESLRVLRVALSEESAGYDIAPKPSPPLDIWVGGSSQAAYRRIGALADGWLGSFLTPDEARGAREAIERAAEQAGRHIEPDHYGISLAVTDAELPKELAAAVRRRRPDVDPGELIAAGWDRLHRQLDAYVNAGLTKFVIRPTGDRPMTDFIERFVAELVGRQN